MTKQLKRNIIKERSESMVIFNLKDYWENTIIEPRILAEPTAKYILKSKQKRT